MARKKTEAQERAERLAEVTEQYPDEFLRCRDTGHGFRPNTAVWLEDGNIERTLICAQCGTLKRQYLSRDGYILSGHYLYAEGYQIVGMGRLNTDARAGLRKVSMERLMA